jgi:hypothetical protein
MDMAHRTALGVVERMTMGRIAQPTVAIRGNERDRGQDHEADQSRTEGRGSGETEDMDRERKSLMVR